MKLTPTGDRILVKVAEPEEKTIGGLIVADSAKEKPQEAEVVAVGKGRFLENGNYAPMEVKVGDTVVFAKYAGLELKEDGEEFLLLENRDVLAIKG